MNSAQKSVIQINLAQLCNEIDVTEILQILRTKLVLTDNNVQTIDNEPNLNAKRVMLLDLIQNKDNAWDAFLDSLVAAQQSYLADLLKDNLECEYSHDAVKKRRVEGHTILDPLYQALQQLLRQNIIQDCEIIRQAWNDCLPVTSLALAFQKLQVIETNVCRTKEIPIDSYDYLIEPSCRIFLIEGDPGIGKSTYVNKIAQDWANGHDILNENFDFVVKLAWLNIDPTDADWKTTIASEFGNEKFINCVIPLLQSNKTLIILDGYDENPLKNVLLEITAKHDSKTGNRIVAKLLITSRGTHVHHFKSLDIMWLRILGFDENSAANFIALQLKDGKSTTEEILNTHTSLIEIYKNPLYATMIAATELTSRLFEMEPQLRVKEIFDQFAALQKERYFRKYQDITKEKYDQLMEKLGRYAFKFLDLGLRRYLRDDLGIRKKLTGVKKLEKEWLKFGVVQCFKRKKATKFVYKITFLHQTFAEYHAANHVAKYALVIINGGNSHRFDDQSNPEFFWSLLLAKKLDLMLEKRSVCKNENKSDYYWFRQEPSAALSCQQLVDYILSKRLAGFELNKKHIDARTITLLSEVQAEEIELIGCTLNYINLMSLKTNQSTKKITFKKCIFPTGDIKAILNWIFNIFAKVCYISIFNSIYTDGITLHLNPSVGFPMRESLDFILSNRVAKVEFDNKEINEKMIMLLSENIQAQEIEALQNSKIFPGRR